MSRKGSWKGAACSLCNSLKSQQFLRHSFATNRIRDLGRGPRYKRAKFATLRVPANGKRRWEFLLIGNFKTYSLGLERLLLEKTWVLVSAPTWWLTSISNLQFRGI